MAAEIEQAMKDEYASGKKPSLAKLLKYGADPNSFTFEDPGERRTLLCLVIDEAAKLDDLTKVDLLLNARADPNKRSETGSFPLLLAAKHKQMKLCRELIQRTADVNQQDQRLVSPLHLAAHANEAKVVQLLIMHKANVNAVDKVGQTPLFFAGGEDVILSLADAQADLLHLNRKGQSALHLAAHNGCMESVRWLSDNDQVRDLIDLPDDHGRTPLHHAAARAHQSVISRLMDVGADPKARTNNGQTAMTLADAKDTDVAYYIYTRVTGSNRSSWREMMHNPIALTLAAIMGVACLVNRKLLWDLTWDIAALARR